MKTQQQRAWEARIRAQLREQFQRTGPHTFEDEKELSGFGDRASELAEVRAFHRRVDAVKRRIDQNGSPLPKGAYRSAAEHHYAYDEFYRRRHYSPLVAHKSEPVSSTGLWTRGCEREDCEQQFVTSARQRMFCSESCARKDQRVKAAAARARYEALTFECARPACTERLFRLRPDHRYCSSRCRDQARSRARVQHVARPCEACAEEFVPKNARARFCTDRCRVRVWEREKRAG